MKPVANAPVPEVTEAAQTSDLAAILHAPDTWVTLAFVVFVALAVRYLVPFINKSLDERSGKIRDQLEQASRLRAEAEELLATYRAQQEQLLKEAESIIAGAKQDAAAMRTQAAEELKANLARRQQQAHEKIARAETEAVGELRKRIIDVATESARNILAADTTRNADANATSRALSAIEQKLA